MILKIEVLRNKTFSAFSDIKILMEESKQKFLNRIIIYSCRAFDWPFDGRNQTGSYAEYQIWSFHQVSIKISFWNFGTIRILMQEKKQTTFCSIDLSQLQKKLIGTFMQQIKPEVAQKIELAYRDKSNSIQLLEYSNYQVFVARNKFDNFST